MPPTVLPKDLIRLLQAQDLVIRGLRDRKTAVAVAGLIRTAKREVAGQMAQFEGRETLTAYVKAQIMFALNRALRQLEDQFGTVLASGVRTAQDQADHDLVGKIAAASVVYKGAEFTPGIAQVMKMTQGTVLRAIETKRIAEGRGLYGDRLVQRVEESLSRSLLSGDRIFDAAHKLLDVDLWKRTQTHAELIVRTEWAHAYNATTAEALDEVCKMDPTMWVMWYEHAVGPEWAGPDDKAWKGPAAPLDDRVYTDSLRLHGQLRKPGQLFVDPGTGKGFAHPPNRPQDRAVLIAVRPGTEVGATNP